MTRATQGLVCKQPRLSLAGRCWCCCCCIVCGGCRAHARGMPMLSVAPEGTLSHGRCLVKFKSGAFVAGVPVIPILLRYRLTPHNPAWTLIIPAWHVVCVHVFPPVHVVVNAFNHPSIHPAPPAANSGPGSCCTGYWDGCAPNHQGTGHGGNITAPLTPPTCLPACCAARPGSCGSCASGATLSPWSSCRHTSPQQPRKPTQPSTQPTCAA